MKRALVAVASSSCSSEDAKMPLAHAGLPEEGWDALRNPFLAFDDVAIKDAFCVWRLLDDEGLSLVRARRDDRSTDG